MVDLKKTVLTIGIAVLLAIFIFYAIDLFYPEPKYEDFCGKYGGYYSPISAPVYNYKEGVGCVPEVNCTPIANINNITRNCTDAGGYIEFNYNDSGCADSVLRCNKCSVDYENARKEHSLGAFYITAPIGVAIVILGMYLPLTIEAIAAGIMFGGFFTLIQTTFWAFNDLDRWAKVIVLAVELVLIIWVGFKKVSEWKPGMDLFKEKGPEQKKVK